MTSLVPAPYRWLALALLMAACLGFGYLKGHEAGSDSVQARWDKANVEQSRQTQAAIVRALAKRDELTAKLKASNDAHLKRLKENQRETARLRDCVELGSCGLRIRARFPTAPDLPRATATPGLGAGAWAELDPSARPAYFALRAGIEQSSAQLAACQAELRLRTEHDQPVTQEPP